MSLLSYQGYDGGKVTPGAFVVAGVLVNGVAPAGSNPVGVAPRPVGITPGVVGGYCAMKLTGMNRPSAALQ
jgi:hypothetical protein